MTILNWAMLMYVAHYIHTLHIPTYSHIPTIGMYLLNEWVGGNVFSGNFTECLCNHNNSKAPSVEIMIMIINNITSFKMQSV